MSTRKSFLAAAASLPLVAAVPSPSASPADAPSKVVPSPKPTPRPPSQAARALAARMQAFDKKLTEKNLDDIARGIDYNLYAGREINPKGEVLKNWDEPVTRFAVPE